MLLLALIGSAWAQGLDATGVPIVAGDGDILDPTLIWRPEVQTPGAWSGALGYGFIEAPYWPLASQAPALDTVHELDLAGTYAVHERVAVGLTVPLFPFSWSSADPSAIGTERKNGFAIGDVRVVAPVGIVLPDADSGGFGFTVVPYLGLPTGASDRFLGDGALSGGLALAPGYNLNGRFDFTGQLGLDLQPKRDLVNRGGGANLLLGAAVSAEVLPTLAAGIEISNSHPLGTGLEIPGVAMASLRGRYDSGLNWKLGGGLDLGDYLVNSGRLYFQIGWAHGRPMRSLGTAIADADKDGVADATDLCPDRPGTAANGCPNDVRVHIENAAGHGVPGVVVFADGKRLGRTGLDGVVVQEAATLGATLTMTAEVDPKTGYSASAPVPVVVTEGGQDAIVELPAAPGSVAIQVTTAGAPLDATASFQGPSELPTLHLGEFGHQVVVLPPGQWTLTLAGEAFEPQTRTVEILPNQRSLIALDVALYAKGADHVDVLVADPSGKPVAGADVVVDGVVRGRSDSLGLVSVGDVKAGATLMMNAVINERAGYKAREPVQVAVAGGAQQESLTLMPLPGAVTVVTRAADGTAIDAKVTFKGPAKFDPQTVGPKGERTFALPPGEWEITVEAPELATETRVVSLRANQKSLIDIEVMLVNATDDFVRFHVQDGRGVPVPGAVLSINGVETGRSDAGGVFTLAGVAAGDALTATVQTNERAGYRPADPLAVTVKDGGDDATFVLDAMPGALMIATQAADGRTVPATVRFEGPDAIPAAEIDGSGEHLFQLSPGAWTVVIESESFGKETRQIEIKPNQRSLITIEVLLVGADKNPVRFRVQDGRDNPIPGADVSVNGAPLGRTDATGMLTLPDAAPGASLVIGVQTNPRAGYQDFAPRTVVAKQGGNEEIIQLDPKPGAIMVSTIANDGTGVDARVTFEGPVPVPAQTVGPTGEHLFDLAPGDWKVTVAHERFGTEVRDIHINPNQRSLISIEVTLVDPTQDSGTKLHLVNELGQPVPGASVNVDGKFAGRTDSGGVLVALGLAAGTHKVDIATNPRAGFAKLAPLDVVVSKGVVEKEVKANWLPGSILLITRTADGRTLDSTVSFHGATEIPDVTIDDGERTVNLPPGRWAVTLRGSGFGTQKYDIDLKPDERSLVKIEVKLQDAEVAVKATAVELLGKILFEAGKAEIKPESFKLVDEIAANLVADRTIHLVEIQGHTDGQGDDASNLKLSQERVDSVYQALVARGVERERLRAKGYGESKPIASNDTTTGREQNRRVEFVILERTE